MRETALRSSPPRATPGITAEPLLGGSNGFEPARARVTPERPEAKGITKLDRSERVPATSLPNAPGSAGAASPLRVLNGAVYFNGDCGACRPYCAAVCCKGYSIVALSEAEARSGRYVYKEESPDCNCEICQRMRARDIKYTLVKRQDGTCVYLDGANRCSIYAHRPETCKQYSCVQTAFRISP